MKKIGLVLLTISFLGGCAATSYHQKQGTFGRGYSETQLSNNVFNVSFSGNEYTDSERAYDFALLRCAELTINHGYRYFVIVDACNTTTYSTFTTPITANTSYGYGYSSTIMMGGQTYVISMPSSSNTIICSKCKPKEGFSYDARFLYKSISEKYCLEMIHYPHPQ